MKVLACLVALPVVLLGWLWWSDRSTERALAPIASEISGRPVAVDCQSLWASLLDIGWRDGEVRFDAHGVPEPRIFLTRDTCARLRAFRGHTRHAELGCLPAPAATAPVPPPPGADCYRRASDTIYALLVLAHEAYHTAGVTDEARTNCYAIQAMAFAATRLGAAEEEARRVAFAMAALAPYQRAGYATADCRAGTALDVHPETPEFPSEAVLAAPRGRGGTPGGR